MLTPANQKADASAISNRLIDALPRNERERFISACERVELTFAHKLLEPGWPIDHIHFPIGGFVSILSEVPDGGKLEVALVGNEGMVGIPVVLGVDVAQEHALVQGAGTALRMSAARFRRELVASGTLRSMLDGYLHARFGQLARAAGCNRYHRVDMRLARWLLMTADRAHSNSFKITHQFIATMLGVRRVGVTTAASVLKQRRLIRYQRGFMEILDREGLEKVSCGCYRADLESYSSVLARA